MMWTEKEIKNLRTYAYQVFKTEIPLSGEIEKLQIFIEQSGMGFKKVSPKLVKTVTATVQWCPNFWTFPMEIEIPESALEELRKQCVNLLNSRCDDLARLCGYTNRTPDIGKQMKGTGQV